MSPLAVSITWDEKEGSEVQNILDLCVRLIFLISDEVQRLMVCQGLINIILDGGFCTKKEPCTLLPAADGSGYRDLMKVSEAQRIALLRQSVGRAH